LSREFLDIIRGKAEEERSAIIRRARAQAEKILEKAEREAEALREEVRARIAEEADRLRERKFNYVRHRMNARIYRMKAAAIESIWRESEKILEKMVKTGGHRKILPALFFECIDSVPEDSVVRAHPDDTEIVLSCIERSGKRLVHEEDPSVLGGVEFHWPGGGTVLRNTLSHRLSRLRNEGNAEISALLFAEKENAGK